MNQPSHSQIAVRIEEAINKLEEHSLVLQYGRESFSITNKDLTSKIEYSNHFVFVNCDTVQEVESFIRGLEAGKKLSLPFKERK